MMKRLRPWIKLSCFFLVLLVYFIWLMLVSFLSGKDQQRGFRIRRNFCKAALKVYNIRVHATGSEYQGACLYISNHRSLLDPLVELSRLDAFILSKAEVKSYPLLGRGAVETGVFFVERENDSSRKAAVQSIEKILRSGSPVIVYPEGTTNGDDLTADFRKGAFEVAFNNNIPVIPVMIEYPDPTYYWTLGTLMDYFKRVFSKAGKHEVILKIGYPVIAPSKEELVAKTRAEIDRMILEARKFFT